MTIHILDTEETPIIGNQIFANCEEKLEFCPINTDIHGSKICPKCLEIHNSLSKSKTPSMYMFALEK